MNAEQEAQTRAGLDRAGIIGVAQDTAVSNLAGMTEGWAPATGTKSPETRPTRPDTEPRKDAELSELCTTRRNNYTENDPALR